MQRVAGVDSVVCHATAAEPAERKQTSRVFDAMAKGLAGIGVDAASYGAGESNTGFMLALEHVPRIRTDITRNEQPAACMACRHAMFTDQLGVGFATAGPGAFDLISGMPMALTS